MRTTPTKNQVLQKEKESHSKVKEIKHKSIQMQKYLQPNNMKMLKEDAQLVFKLRCRVTGVKSKREENMTI